MVVLNAPRWLRSYLHRKLGGDNKLFLLSPKQTGRKLWHYATLHQGNMVVLGKGVPTRDIGRDSAVNRFGVPARELRPKRKLAA